MALNKADYIAQGSAAFNAGNPPSAVAAVSWQEKAWMQGYEEAKEASGNVDHIEANVAKIKADAQGEADDKLLADLGVDMETLTLRMPSAAAQVVAGYGISKVGAVLMDFAELEMRVFAAMPGALSEHLRLIALEQSDELHKPNPDPARIQRLANKVHKLTAKYFKRFGTLNTGWPEGFGGTTTGRIASHAAGSKLGDALRGTMPR